MNVAALEALPPETPEQAEGASRSEIAARTAKESLGAVIVPERTGYRFKNKVLGAPLHNEQLQHERLGKPTALAVFASDNLSSCAYATEEILRVLLPAIGLAAFRLVTPITFALLVVLGFLILSYRQTIKAYPSAGGAYIVTRDNFGLLPAQVAGVALLTDYILTVAVSVAAGSDALASAFPALEPYKLPIALFFVGLLAYGNLRGVKESGKLFAAPTYFFVLNMGVLLTIGAYRWLFTSLPRYNVNPSVMKGIVPVHSDLKSFAVLAGASVWITLKAFGSGGAAVTGVEAISNGVPAFKEPAWKNARDTLVIMGTLLGVMFLGLSLLAAKVHAPPFKTGSPTVISQVGEAVYGKSPLGHVLYLCLQAGTMLILVLAANTSFADFPRLASFHAGDNFMPRQFMVRGHRLVFSNGIIFLAAAGMVTLLGTGGKVSRLIPLYAIGVFTSFTLSQAGMAKHHTTHKEPKWKTGLFINATGAVLSALVLVIVAAVKFTEGAWVIMLLIPIMVFGLMRLNRAYEHEDAELKEAAAKLAVVSTVREHRVLVLVDNLDVAAARAIQFGRALRPVELRAVHFDLDPWKSHLLSEEWRKLGFDKVPLDVVECTDRRLARGVVDVVIDALSDGRTELSVVIPRREYSAFWHRLLHDRSSRAIEAALHDLPHCSVTVVPYRLGTGTTIDERVASQIGAATTATPRDAVSASAAGLSTLAPRQHASVVGRVRSMRIQPFGGNPSLECVLADATGLVTLVFTGRRQIAGIRVGTRLTAEGNIAVRYGRPTLINPAYAFDGPVEELVAPHH